MRGLVCGPKMAACGMVLSLWGVIMLGLLGIFFTLHSAVLIEDVALDHEDFHDTGSAPLQRIYAQFDAVGYNCFIAAAVYLVVGAFSCCQMKLNNRRAYLVH
ncbi:ribonuclease kappa-A-like [Nelusetta ayraudi]|uniref:ribonuclease kappa-A-like n=1 Tax=Nelusetta ayraudi TaxID=303726 RepID=UPI003F72FD7F